VVWWVVVKPERLLVFDGENMLAESSGVQLVVAHGAADDPWYVLRDNGGRPLTHDRTTLG
jgi:hypothetical protein